MPPPLAGIPGPDTGPRLPCLGKPIPRPQAPPTLNRCPACRATSSQQPRPRTLQDATRFVAFSAQTGVRGRGSQPGPPAPAPRGWARPPPRGRSPDHGILGHFGAGLLFWMAWWCRPFAPQAGLGGVPRLSRTPGPPQGPPLALPAIRQGPEQFHNLAFESLPFPHDHGPVQIEFT